MPRALVVEDDDFSMRVFDHILRRNGFDVIHARTAADALSVTLDSDCELDLIVCDLKLPDLRGTAIPLELTAKKVCPPVLFTSGTPLEGWTETELADLERLASHQRVSFQPKPFQARALEARLSTLLHGGIADRDSPALLDDSALAA